MNKIVMISESSDRVLELLRRVLAKAFGLVFDSYSDDFCVFDQVGLRSDGARSRIELAEITEVVEVLDHQFEDIRVVTRVVRVVAGVGSRFELDDSALSLLVQNQYE